MAIWHTKFDARADGEEVDVDDEGHVVGEDLSGLVQLREVPRQHNPGGASVYVYAAAEDLHFTEVTGVPAPGQFRVRYDLRDRLAGTVEFNPADDGREVQVSYLGRGSAVFARDINRLQSLKLDDAFVSVADRAGATQLRADGASALKFVSDDANIGVRYDPLERQVGVYLNAAAKSPINSTVLLWLDAARIPLADGSPVHTWYDAGGMNHHFTQSDLARRPVFRRSGVAGRPVVRFDGIDDVLVNSTLAVTTATIFVVVARGTGTGAQRLVGNNANLSLGTNAFGHLSTRYGNGTAWGTEVAHGSDAYVRPGGFQLVSLLQTGTAESVYLQNRLVGSGPAAMSAFTDGLHLGGDPVANAQFWSGDIAEVLVVGGATYDKSWDRYFMAKYGINLVDPSSLSGVLAWFDAGGLNLADGTPVASWPDRIGTGANLTQATALKQPTFRAGVAGGRAAVRFDGDDDVLSLATEMDAKDVFLVVGNYAFTGDDMVVMGGLTADEAIRVRTSHQIYASTTGGAQLVNSMANVPDSGFRIFQLSTDGTHASLRGNGVTLARTPSSTVFTFGQLGHYRNLATPEFFGGDVAEVLIYNRVLNVVERKRVEQYLSDKYDIPVQQAQPVDVPGLRAWYDAGQLALESGARVALWPDLSPTDGHLSQATVSRQPTFVKPAVAGRPAVAFDGIDDFIYGGISALAAPFTVFAVGQFAFPSQPAGNSDTMVFLGTTGTNATASISRSGSSNYFSAMSADYAGSTPATGPVLPGQEWMILAAVHQPSEPRHQMYLNSIAQTVASYGTAASTIGRINLGAEFFEKNHFTGQIAEVIVYDRALTDEERVLVEAYLGAKYAVDLLP